MTGNYLSMYDNRQFQNPGFPYPLSWDPYLGAGKGAGNGSCLTGGFDSKNINLNSISNPGSTIGGSNGSSGSNNGGGNVGIAGNNGTYGSGGQINATLTMEKCNGSWNQKWIFDTANRRLRLQGQDMCVSTYDNGNSYSHNSSIGYNAVTVGMVITLANCDYTNLNANTGSETTVGGTWGGKMQKDNQDFMLEASPARQPRIVQPGLGGSGFQYGDDPAILTYGYQRVTGERPCYFHSNTSRIDGFVHTDLGCSYDMNLTREQWIVANVNPRYWSNSLTEKYQDQSNRNALEIARRNANNLSESQKREACERGNGGGGTSNSTNPANCLELTTAITPKEAEVSTDTPMEISYFFDQNYVLTSVEAMSGRGNGGGGGSNGGGNGGSGGMTSGNSGRGNGGSGSSDQSMVWIMRKGGGSAGGNGAGGSNQKWWYFPRTGEIKTSIGGLGTTMVKTIGEDPEESFKNGNGRVFSVMDRKSFVQLNPGDVGYFSSLKCLDAGDLGSSNTSSGGSATGSGSGSGNSFNPINSPINSNQTLRIHPCHGQSNQSWNFSPDYTIYLRNVLAKQAGYPSGNGGGQSNGDSQMCMDIAGNDGQVGDNFAVRVLPCNLRMNQCFVSGLGGGGMTGGTNGTNGGGILPLTPGCIAPRPLTDLECSNMYSGGRGGTNQSTTSYWRSTGKASRDNVGSCVLVEPKTWSDEVRGGYSPEVGIGCVGNSGGGIGGSVDCGNNTYKPPTLPKKLVPIYTGITGNDASGSGGDEGYDIEYGDSGSGGSGGSDSGSPLTQSKCLGPIYQWIFSGVLAAGGECYESSLNYAGGKNSDPTICGKFHESGSNSISLEFQGQDELSGCYSKQGADQDRPVEIEPSVVRDMIGLATGLGVSVDTSIAKCFLDSSGYENTMSDNVKEFFADITPFLSEYKAVNEAGGYNVITGQTANCINRVISSAGLVLQSVINKGAAGAGATAGCAGGGTIGSAGGPIGVGIGCVVGGSLGAVGGFVLGSSAVALFKNGLRSGIKGLIRESVNLGVRFIAMTIATGSVLKKGLRTVSGAVDYFLTKDGRTRIIRAVVGNTYKASGKVYQWTVRQVFELKPLAGLKKATKSVVEGCLKAGGGSIVPNTLADNSLFDKSFARSFVEEVIGIGGVRAGAANVPCIKALEQLQKLLIPYGIGEFPFRPLLDKGGNLIKRDNGYVDELGNLWQSGRVHGIGAKEWDVQLSQKGKNYLDFTNFEPNKIKIAKEKGYININELGGLSH